MARDPAMSAFLECGVLSYGIASALNNGIMNGFAKADARREERARRQYADDLAEAQWRADDLGRIAIANAQKIAALEAENRRLRKALDQRTAVIDRMRSAA